MLARVTMKKWVNYSFVTEVAGDLQRAGDDAYSRGRIHIAAAGI
jgi:hypothetical protein